MVGDGDQMVDAGIFFREEKVEGKARLVLFPEAAQGDGPQAMEYRGERAGPFRVLPTAISDQIVSGLILARGDVRFDDQKGDGPAGVRPVGQSLLHAAGECRPAGVGGKISEPEQGGAIVLELTEVGFRFPFKLRPVSPLVMEIEVFEARGGGERVLDQAFDNGRLPLAVSSEKPVVVGQEGAGLVVFRVLREKSVQSQQSELRVAAFPIHAGQQHGTVDGIGQVIFVDETLCLSKITV